MAIQIGKYKRPGIFIEEIDKSIISTNSVDGITNMVIGVSKKGPVNTAIRLTTPSDLESIFGQLDRGLERKGSFFHRTIQKMLETSPVYAVNLLLTDNELDLLEYKSISSSSGFVNDIKREAPYKNFFDTTGFWKKDTESFINITKNNTGYSERAFNLTNMSDKYVTVFLFKSTKSGFDRTLIEWYGSQEKVPPYVNSKDWASDYMVDVLIVSGDWSNYQDLAIDSRWNKYFNSSGLIKSQVGSFSNDRNVTTLAYYQGLSLIPYFRDSNGANIFIETTINRDTDTTGVFCSFNSDLVEVDYYNGLLDLIGQTTAGINESSIEFLSYKETIAESIKISAVPLDLPGNVTSILGGSFSYSTQINHTFDTGNGPETTGIAQNANRTAWFGEGFVNGLTLQSTPSSTPNSISLTYSITDNSFAIIGDTYIPISTTGSFTISASDYAASSGTISYCSTFILDNTGSISVVNNKTNSSKPSVSATDIVLGYMTFSVVNQLISTASVTFKNVNVNTTGFVDFTFGTSSTDDYYISKVSSGTIKVVFENTANTPSVSNYEQYRRIKLFNKFVNLLSSANKAKMTICLGSSNSYKKASLSNMSIDNIVTSATSNKSFNINTGLSDAELTDILKGYLVIYTLDNEFILSDGTLTGSLGVTTTENKAGATYGVVAKYSKLYTSFYDGTINTGDYFYDNLIPTAGTSVNITFTVGATGSYEGYNYVVIESTTDPAYEIGYQFIVPDSTDNTGSFTVESNIAGLAQDLGYPSGYYAYQVTESVTSETVLGVTEIYNYLNKIYLKMYLDTSNVLYTYFTDENYNVIDPIDIEKNNTFYIQSAKTNYKQSVEIEEPTGYVPVANKILIKSARYTEVKVGDYLSAYYNESGLVSGEVPRKLTRILSKKAYTGDSSLVEITCDSSILKTNFSGDLQTTRYTNIDNYATTYKGITLKGFRLRQASMPDGTEERQNQILDIVAKGTPLYNAITNKEAIDFRYLIDSFGLGLVERSKQQLVDICGGRLDAFGFINMPSMKEFKNSSSPSFVDSNGVLQLEYVSIGGNPEDSPAFLYSFGDGDGSTSVGYFMPYVTVNDNGRPISVPPAAYVATTYMRKHLSNISGITPWTIAAGVSNGRITNISSLEMNFTNSDLEFINGAQMNPIVFKRNRGNVIETENTAQVLYKSALSYIHVREVLIELERELSRMLLDYQWKFNTPEVRAEIKLRADVICDTYVSKNGLYNYFNKMDEENNTSEIIDNQIGVLDTYVEPIKGMGIIVNNITILRTGAISAGGFLN